MPKLLPWNIRGRQYELGARPWLMGIVNVTPDSFSDGGQWIDPAAATAHALQLVADGADILDVGGESTRPGALPVSAEEELRRVVPVVLALAGQTSCLISVDTTKAIVAREALEAGAHIINDISGLTFDSEMPAVCREFSAGVVCMHIQGTPQTMQLNPTYHDVVSEVCLWLQQRLAALVAAGIAAESICFDPGIGFGKTAAHNLQLLSSIETLRTAGRPVLIGHSRKRFLKHLLGRDVEERLAGTLGVAVALAAQGVDLLRVHDVRATRDACAAWSAIMQGLPTE